MKNDLKENLKHIGNDMKRVLSDLSHKTPGDTLTQEERALTTRLYIERHERYRRQNIWHTLSVGLGSVLEGFKSIFSFKYF